MNTGSPKSLDSRAWRDLYRAALFEVDNARLPERIAQAEKALALRALECFMRPNRRLMRRSALGKSANAEGEQEAGPTETDR
jgi:hypothetical protein